MSTMKIQGTEFFINIKHEDLYELSLILSGQVIHSFGFNLNNYIQMINYLKQTKFSQNIDYSLDPEKLSSFYITRWETNGVPTYCSRAWINNTWSQYSLIEEQALKMLPKNLESLIQYNAPIKTTMPIVPKSIVPSQKIIEAKNELPNQSIDIEAMKKEMLGFLKVEKDKMMKGQ